MMGETVVSEMYHVPVLLWNRDRETERQRDRF